MDETNPVAPCRIRLRTTQTGINAPRFRTSPWVRHPFLALEPQPDSFGTPLEKFYPQESRIPEEETAGVIRFKIGDSLIMLADEHQEIGVRGPQTIGGTSVGILLYVEDVDAVWSQAIVAGAKVQREVKSQFYGDRSGTFEDPFGHVWTIATHVEDVSFEEIEKRLKQEHSG